MHSILIVHKQIALVVNVSFTYFSYIFSLLVATYAQKLPTKCFLLILKVLGTHVIVLHRA